MMRAKRSDEELLIFPWRGLEAPFFPKLVATGVVLAVFAAALAGLRVRVEAPPQWAERKGSVIYLPAEGEGWIWSRRAEEGGPYPSRFRPDSWEGMKALEAEVAEAVRVERPPYVPALRDLPEAPPVAPVALAAKGQRVFPEREVLPAKAPAAGYELVPVLYPLSDMPAEALPENLPAFGEEIDVAMTATPWRFLVRLRPEGGVAECVSLAGTAEAAVLPLEKWLRTLRFDAAFAAENEWIALAVGFVNRSVHGPDAR